MRKIVYYVATSLDGYICGPNNDISGFAEHSDGVAKYLDDLKEFDTVIMGRKTYEFGYQFGLKPGQPAYAHMEHFIFSDTLTFDQPHEKVHVVKRGNLDQIRQLKETDGTDIYLCGGGDFAGWLLDHEMIDVLKIKLNPLVLGDGVTLFGQSKKSHQLDLILGESYTEGLYILTYAIRY